MKWKKIALLWLDDFSSQGALLWLLIHNLITERCISSEVKFVRDETSVRKDLTMYDAGTPEYLFTCSDGPDHFGRWVSNDLKKDRKKYDVDYVPKL